MKALLVGVLLLSAAACKIEEPKKTNGIKDYTGYSDVYTICYEGIKYIMITSGITAKINETSRLPERCTE